MTALNLWPRITSVPLGTALVGDINPDTTAATKSFLLSDAIKAATADNQILVAASDSPASIKAIANYVCDGTDDDVQINAAIAALPAAGGVVVLGPGNFVAEGITLVPGVWIRGAGIQTGTTISLPAVPASAMFVSGAEATFKGGGISDLYLAGLDAGKNCIDFSAVTTTLDQFFVERCLITDFAVGVQGSPNDRFLTINDCLIWSCTVAGVLSNEHVRLHNVDFRNNAIGLTGDLIHCPISFCKFVTNGIGVQPAAGGEIQQSTFNNCMFFGNTHAALEINRTNTVTGCVILGGTAPTNVGIRIVGSGSNSITGNRIGAASYRFDGGAIVFQFNAAVGYDNSVFGNGIYCNTSAVCPGGCRGPHPTARHSVPSTAPTSDHRRP